jgi:hypothetical protein
MSTANAGHGSSNQEGRQFRRDLRYRRLIGLAIVLWETRFRLVVGANIDVLVQLYRRELESHVRADRVRLATNETIPSDRTLRRILEDVAQASYEWTKQLETQVKRFRKIYDRDVEKRMQLLEVDCLFLDHRLLAAKGIDFVAIDEAGAQPIEPVAMNAIDRKSRACPGAQLYPRMPVTALICRCLNP